MTTTEEVPATTTNSNGGEEEYIEDKIGDVILVYGFMTIWILGTLSNIASLVVLRCKSFRTSSGSSRLSTLAVLHLVFLYTPVLRGWIYGIFKIDVRKSSSFGCKLHVFLTYYIGHLCTWALTLIVMERALVVCFHVTFKQYATKKNILIVWSLVAVALALLNSHFFFTFDLVPDPFKETISAVTQTPLAGSSTLLPSIENETTVVYECFRHSQYEFFYVSIWPSIDNTVLIVLPFIFILSGNIAIFVVIRRAMAFQAKNSTKRTRRDSSDGHDKGSPTHSTLMLIAASIAFLLLSLPNGIFFIINERSLSEDNSPALLAKYTLAYSITTFLFYLGTAINFFIYYVSGSKFRKSCRECFSTNFFKSEANPLDTRTSTSKL